MEKEFLEEEQNPNYEATEADSENPEQEDLDTYESEDDGTDEQDESVEERKVEQQKPKNKTAEKFDKLRDKNREYKDRLEAIEKELAIEKLSKTYWEIDSEAVAAIKKENKTLAWEDCVILWSAKKPKVETKKQSSNFIGRESSWWKREFVTDADLIKASNDWTYDSLMEKIESWKLIHKK